MAATFEITWQGVAVVLTSFTLGAALLAKVFRSSVGHRIGEAIFAPILYELRTNDGGSLKDHIMRRFDAIEERQGEVERRQGTADARLNELTSLVNDIKEQTG